MDFIYITSFDFWLSLTLKAMFAAVMGKSGYEKWKVNKPGVFCLLFYDQSHEMQKKKNGCWSCLLTE